MSNYRSYAASTKNTPQNKPIPGRESEMVKNNAGGYVFKTSDWSYLDRFLILGSEGNTYYSSGTQLTVDAAKNVINLVRSSGVDLVSRVVEISESGRAPKNEPALFCLALAMTHGDAATKQAAYDALPKVARIGTHVLHLAEYVNSMRGWGRGVRRAFGNWYLSQTPHRLATNLVKYANRDGWTHRDILRLSHPSATGVHQSLLAYAANKPADFTGTDIGGFMEAVERVKSADVKTAVKLILEHRLPREVLPTELLNNAEVWEALLPHMGITALIRNVATMTRNGLLVPLSASERSVIEKVTDQEVLRKGRVHPIQLLSAYLTYGSGRSARGSNTWAPNPRLVAALENGFYQAFNTIVPTGKNFYLGIDISGSMTMGEIAGIPGLTPNIAAAVMAMVTARTEKNSYIEGFASSNGGMWSTGAVMKNLGITSNDTIDSVRQKTTSQSFGRTDCALPMIDAKKRKIPVDTFVIYTDNETWAGNVAPVQALRDYRQAMGIDAKVVVVGMTVTNFTIADPTDKGMLDVVGFDSAAPNLISEFSKGNI